MPSLTPSCLAATALVALFAAPSLAAGADTTLVRSADLQLEFRAPSGWIVRHLADGDEHIVAITRELLQGFPRYHVGFTATSVNGARRKAKRTPSSMARGLCAMAQKRDSTGTRCLESEWNGFLRVEWSANFAPVSGATEGTRAWIVCLADDGSDVLLRAMFEAPQSEWAGLEGTAKALIGSVRRLSP